MRTAEEMREISKSKKEDDVRMTAERCIRMIQNEGEYKIEEAASKGMTRAEILFPCKYSGEELQSIFKIVKGARGVTCYSDAGYRLTFTCPKEAIRITFSWE